MSAQVLPVSQYNDECTISFENFRILAERKELVATICGHKFSQLFLATWIEQKASCPVCRTSLQDTPMVPVALHAASVARGAMAASASSSSSSQQARTINGDLSEAEALTIALTTIQSKTAAELRQNQVNGDLSVEEALVVAEAESLNTIAERRLSEELAFEEATQIALSESARA